MTLLSEIMAEAEKGGGKSEAPKNHADALAEALGVKSGPSSLWPTSTLPYYLRENIEGAGRSLSEAGKSFGEGRYGRALGYGALGGMQGVFAPSNAAASAMAAPAAHATGIPQEILEWPAAFATGGAEAKLLGRGLRAGMGALGGGASRALPPPPAPGGAMPPGPPPQTPIGPQRWSEIFNRPASSAPEMEIAPQSTGGKTPTTPKDVEKAVADLVKGGATTGGAAKGAAVAHGFEKGRRVTVASALNPKAPGQPGEIISITEGARPRALVRFADFTQKEVPLKLLTPLGD